MKSRLYDKMELVPKAIIIGTIIWALVCAAAKQGEVAIMCLLMAILVAILEFPVPD